jgi:hypothetical protein
VNLAVKDNDTILLQLAVDKLYITFAKYPLQKLITKLPGLRLAEDPNLYKRPLKAISGKELDGLAIGGYEEWGITKDYKHFLPRILDLLAFEPEEIVGGFDASLILFNLYQSLASRDWDDEAVQELEAIETYLLALWRVVLKNFPDFLSTEAILHGSSFILSTDDLFRGIALVVRNIEPFLKAWRDNNSVDAFRHLSHFIISHSDSIWRDWELQGYWEPCLEKMQQIIAWLLDPGTKQSLEQAFFDHFSEPYAAEFSKAIEILVSVHKVQ